MTHQTVRHDCNFNIRVYSADNPYDELTFNVEASGGGVRGNEGNAVLRRGSLAARFLDDVLVRAGQAAQVVQHLQEVRHPLNLNSDLSGVIRRAGQEMHHA